MKKEFIPYKQALELKKLGFDEECLAWTIPNETNFIISPCEKYGERFDKMVQIPTFSQCFRWFREKYLLFGYPFPNDYQNYGYRIVEMTSDENKELVYDWGTKDSVEEAELECLKKLIEIVKEK